MPRGSTVPANQPAPAPRRAEVAADHVLVAVAVVDVGVDVERQPAETGREHPLVEAVAEVDECLVALVERAGPDDLVVVERQVDELVLARPRAAIAKLGSRDALL